MAKVESSGLSRLTSVTDRGRYRFPGQVQAERAALLDITKAEGKPEQGWDKIVEGRLSAWFRETVLLEQGLHGDKTTVQEALGEGRIVRFIQAYIGN